MVGDAVELAAAFDGAGPDDDVVVMLTGMSYSDVGIDFVADAEIAVLGSGNTTISGNRPGGLISTGGSGIVYFGGVSISGNISGNGIACSGTSVWLDDSEVRNNAQVGLDVSGGCAAHLRRSVVRANDSGGIVASGSPIYLVNTAVAENVDTLDVAGIRITNGELWASYSTIVANLAVADAIDNIQCFGNPVGEVRNSIVTAIAGSSISGCDMINWNTNALDTDLGGSNQPVGYEVGWFEPAEGDYHLTTAGETIFMGIASWQPGDPLTDIDGDAIPTDGPSFPGYDQP